MELKEFVKKSVLDITNAVFEARKEAELAIAPGYVEGQSMKNPQMVDFEIVVTTGAEGSGGISVLSSAKLNASKSSEHMNKISFSIPVYFQAMNPSKEKK